MNEEYRSSIDANGYPDMQSSITTVLTTLEKASVSNLSSRNEGDLCIDLDPHQIENLAGFINACMNEAYDQFNTSEGRWILDINYDTANKPLVFLCDPRSFALLAETSNALYVNNYFVCDLDMGRLGINLERMNVLISKHPERMGKVIVQMEENLIDLLKNGNPAMDDESVQFVSKSRTEAEAILRRQKLKPNVPKQQGFYNSGKLQFVGFYKPM